MKSVIYLFCAGLLVTQNLWSNPAPKSLTLDNASDLFRGDWLDSWEDPEDYRFTAQGIDLTSYFEKTTPIREELYRIRQKYIKKFKAIEDSPKADFLGLVKEITRETMDFTAKYLDKARPQSVTKDEVAFISFGSMARGEAGIITDLEGSLLWDEKAIGKEALGMDYGQALSNILNGLLGHPIYGTRGFRLDEAEHSPFHRAPWANKLSLPETFCWAIKATSKGGSPESKSFRKTYFYPFEGSWAYTNATPELLADYVKSGYIENWPSIWDTKLRPKDYESDWYKWVKPYLTPTLIQATYVTKSLKNGSCARDLTKEQIEKFAGSIASRLERTEISTISNFPQLSRNRVFVYGNKNLFDEFDRGREDILNDNHHYLRKKLTFKFLYELVDHFGDPKRGIATGKAGDVVDIKRVNYRFEEQLLTNLAFLLDLEQQNQGDIIQKLVAMDLFGKDFGQKSLDRVNQIFRLRIKKQAALQSQLPPKMQFLTKEAHEDKLKELKATAGKLKAKIRHAHKSASNVEILEAKDQLKEVNADLALMPKLIPGEDDSIFTPKDVTYIRESLFPEQADLLKRLKAFLADNKDKTRDKFDFSAFMDKK
jgi:hypothetical protein